MTAPQQGYSDLLLFNDLFRFAPPSVAPCRHCHCACLAGGMSSEQQASRPRLAQPDPLSRACEAAKAGDSQLLHALLLEHGVAFCRAPDSLMDGGSTPAHYAARNGHADCLRVLHELDSAASLVAATTDGFTPAHAAAQNGHTDCLLALRDLGVLDLRAKQAWIKHRLDEIVGDTDLEGLSLVARRGSVLDGLCATLGVDESTGRLVGGSASAARRLDVRFEGEIGGGDGLRREWFGEVLGELLDPSRGLFAGTGGRTLQPNPHSATLAGPDHLSYFALLGRIAGLALCHSEPLNASWSSVCEQKSRRNLGASPLLHHTISEI